MPRLILSALFLAAGVTTGAAQTDKELAFAKAYLDGLQDRSFRNTREYCGYFGYDRNGDLVAVKPQPGTASTCRPRWPHASIRVIASYHSHGAWDDETDGEVPSVEDVLGDMDDQIDGYVSTPGGRLWFIEGKSGISRQVCGRACLLEDPGFQAEPAGSVPDRMTLDQLKDRQGD